MIESISYDLHMKKKNTKSGTGYRGMWVSPQRERDRDWVTSIGLERERERLFGILCRKKIGLTSSLSLKLRTEMDEDGSQ